MSGKSLKNWIVTARPHTLTLALSCAGMGIIAAANSGYYNLKITIFSLLTALLLQILSNVANDYGDFKHGTDNHNRKGPKRALQKGDLSPKQIKTAIILLAALSFISGIFLLIFAFSNIRMSGLIILLIAGILAIWAAIAYTAAKNPYGYKGFGDFFVFIFFGLFAVAGTFFLHSGIFRFIALLPAASIGFLSVAVLNLNNLRDIDNDKISGKITLAVRLGYKNTVIYQTILIVLAFFSMFIYNFIENNHKIFLLQTLPFLLLFPSLIRLFSVLEAQKLYGELKKLSLIILLIVFFQLMNLIF